VTTDSISERQAVVIPCFNEAFTVRKVVEDFSRALPDAVIYVFDNNSTDQTAQIARDAGATVVRSPIQGKGNVIRHMSRVVDADVYILVDGDDTYPAAAVSAMLERFRRDDLDMLVGTRLEGFEKRSFRPFHRFGNRFISWLVSMLFGKGLTDGFEVETEMTLQALTKHLAVGEMPVEYGSRPEQNPSKLNTWGDGWLILKCMALLFKDYRPLVFFSGVSIILAIASLIAGSAPVRDYIEISYVLHVPRAILAASLAVLSLIALTAGLILDTVVRLHEETVAFWKQQLEQLE